MFKRILIANRGEIAVRIIRACREMGVETVAVYSEADAGSRHAALADQAVLIGPPPPSESYLNIHRLIDVAVATGCEAVHPGYGFLSERAPFAHAVREAGLVFIGPPAESIEAMGSKTAARALMEQAGVPIVPGYQGGGGLESYRAAAERIGYPVLVKASGGGGGKGMRVVDKPGDLAPAIEGASREAYKAFGDDRVYLEKLVIDPRHVEVQTLADTHGQTVHLFERDCSVQRRHQKIIEETPSPALDPTTRARMGTAAVAASQVVGYVNAGTVEFLLAPDGQFYFLEMNTRLQVEHPVTEAVVGVDLVKLQLRIAAGERLPFSQADLSQRGHAVEVRVYAEDPAAGFLPSTGPLLRVVEPGGPNVRVDSGFGTGDQVSHFYDPLLAKLIVWGATRDDALATLRRALNDYVILGVTTNLAYLRAIIDHPVFRRGAATTAFVDREMAAWSPQTETPDLALVAAALADLMMAGGGTAPAQPTSGDGDPFNPWRVTDTKEKPYGATLLVG